MLTTLAVIFVVGLVLAVFYGFSIVMRRPPTIEDLTTEKCTICRQKYDKRDLVEREVGDYKLLYFCRVCIESLSRDCQTSLRTPHQQQDHVLPPIQP